MQQKDSQDIFEELQAMIDREMEAVYSKKTILYFKNPINIGRMEHSDGAAKMKGECGDTMEMYLQIEVEIIKEIQYFTDGCGVTIACGSAITDFIKGKTIHDALKISPYILIDELGGLPRDDVHCAILSVATLHQAIADYLFKTQ